MPPGQPVGPASFLRVRVDPGGDQINVVLPDGRQYRIDRPHTPGRQQSVTLSRSGRYVVWTTPAGSVLRDLMTGDDLPVVPEQFRAVVAGLVVAAGRGVGATVMRSPTCSPGSTS